MSEKESNQFIFDDIRVFFKHTDRSGKLHYSNYFDWTGFTREAYFQDTVPNFREVIERPIKMMTVQMEHEIFEDAEFGDQIQVRLTVGKIKRFSFEMIVRYFRKRDWKLLCTGKHTVVFIDSDSGKFANIPEEMMRVIVQYQEDGKTRGLTSKIRQDST